MFGVQFIRLKITLPSVIDSNQVKILRAAFEFSSRACGAVAPAMRYSAGRNKPGAADCLDRTTTTLMAARRLPVRLWVRSTPGAWIHDPFDRHWGTLHASVPKK
jgi:hypothetical protein